MKHYESTVRVPAEPDEVFAFIDDHEQFSAHMAESSWMMGGSSMQTTVDDGRGQRTGSHIRMHGKVLGIGVDLDEVITAHTPPSHKAWETLGEPHLIVVGAYRIAVDVAPFDTGSSVRVSIDYERPRRHAWLGRLFGAMYARWCVKQMASGVRNHFARAGA